MTLRLVQTVSDLRELFMLLKTEKGSKNRQQAVLIEGLTLCNIDKVQSDCNAIELLLI